MAIHFHDRQTAGRLLAFALEKYANDISVVVYALPRGGVVLGAVVADALHAPLSLVMTRKLEHPFQKEFAIGAVTETGKPLLDQGIASTIDSDWLQLEIERQRKEVTRRREKYMGGQTSLVATDKIAILVDDGIATGYTMRAALSELRPQIPRKLVVAVPVAPTAVVARLEQEADEVVCLDPGYDYLGAVGAYYDNYPQVSDDEVIQILRNGS